jgi:hypothetical protein
MTIYPFRGSDFDVGGALAELDLSRPQLALLKCMLESIELRIWFDDKEDVPTLELVVFWENIGDVDETVATRDLLPIFEHAFDERNVIGDEEEIVALEKFRNVIDAAIEVRLRSLASCLDTMLGSSLRRPAMIMSRNALLAMMPGARNVVRRHRSRKTT